MGTSLELPHDVNSDSRRIESQRIAGRRGAPLTPRSRAVNARMLAVVFVGLTGISTPWKISAPSTPAVVAAEPRSADEIVSPVEGLQDPSRMLLIGAALIAIAAAVRRSDTETPPR